MFYQVAPGVNLEHKSRDRLEHPGVWPDPKIVLHKPRLFVSELPDFSFVSARD